MRNYSVGNNDYCHLKYKQGKGFQQLSLKQCASSILLTGSLMLGAGCDSGESGATASSGNVPVPEVNRILDIPSLVRVAAANLPESNNLLTNGSFENDLDGWGACEDLPKLKITGTSSDGSR